jgi:hypothetical protein
MTETYRTRPQESRVEAAPVVVHCSDPRYQPHFQDFLRNGLGLDHYALIAVPGGSQFLTLALYLPKFSWVGWRWMKFVLDLTKPSRVILIAHDDCRWYLDMRFGHDALRVREKMLDDLRKVRAELAERLGPTARIETYFARLEGDSAHFEPV